MEEWEKIKKFPEPRYMKDILAQKTKMIDTEPVDFGNISEADDIINTINFLLDRHGILIDVHYDPEHEEKSYVKLLKVI